MTTASVAAVIILAGNNAVDASEIQTLDPAQEGADNPTQDNSQKVAESGPTTKVNVDSQGVILRGYDVVAYFKQGRPVQGKPAFESRYQGAIYLFASSVDKTDFEKDPAKYAPRYGGFCSYALSVGILADLEGPDAFAVYKDRLYVFGNQRSLKGFKTNIETNIGKADANWLLLGTNSTNAPSSRAGGM